ncbi:glycosyltransferase family 2 protein [Loigolactobacillus zhaoyuanensis]|uniref:glycosyltransferase family 2 protein n=1 Tax=Loigolactobacillus zhaoyuanensis TaxID=2486017 RepID=UPI0013DE49E1|nr:glycosyltransferase family 2 protein [Loigolactobacillus zhaoyuanensis]
MDLSIIVPTFNSEKYLDETLNSIIPLLDVLNAEIVVVDDGSTDDTQKIILKYKKRLNIRVIYNSHKGVGYSRNMGISKSRGAYITFIDSDDLIVVDKYIEMMKAIKLDRKIDIVSMSFMVHPENDKLVIENNDMKLKEKLLLSVINITTDRFSWNEYNSGPISKIFSREFILENNIKFPVEISNGEDMIFNYMAAKNSKKTLLLRGGAYKYRRTQGSLMHEVNAEFRDLNLILLNEIKNLIYQTDDSGSIYRRKSVLYYWNVRLILTNFVRLYSRSKSDKFIDEKKIDSKTLRKQLKNSEVRNIICKSFSNKQKIIILIIAVLPGWLVVKILHLLNHLGLVGNLRNTKQMDII